VPLLYAFKRLVDDSQPGDSHLHSEKCVVRRILDEENAIIMMQKLARMYCAKVSAYRIRAENARIANLILFCHAITEVDGVL